MSEDSKSLVQSKARGDKKIHLVLHLIDGSEITEINARAINAISQYCAVVPVLSKGDMIDSQSIRFTKDLISKRAESAGLPWLNIPDVKHA